MREACKHFRKILWKNEKSKYLSIFLSRLHTSEENNDNMSRSARQSASWWCFSFTHCMLFTAKSPTYSLRKKAFTKAKKKCNKRTYFNSLGTQNERKQLIWLNQALKTALRWPMMYWLYGRIFFYRAWKTPLSINISIGSKNQV